MDTTDYIKGDELLRRMDKLFRMDAFAVEYAYWLHESTEEPRLAMITFRPLAKNERYQKYSLDYGRGGHIVKTIVPWNLAKKLLKQILSRCFVTPFGDVQLPEQTIEAVTYCPSSHKVFNWPFTMFRIRNSQGSYGLPTTPLINKNAPLYSRLEEAIKDNFPLVEKDGSSLGQNQCLIVVPNYEARINSLRQTKTKLDVCVDTTLPATSLSIIGKAVYNVHIPMKSNTHSERSRTAIPIEIEQLRRVEVRL